jgi:hypothetical protein
MITIFCDHFFHNLPSFVSSPNDNFFADFFFGENILKITTSVPDPKQSLSVGALRFSLALRLSAQLRPVFNLAPRGKL